MKHILINIDINKLESSSQPWVFFGHGQFFPAISAHTQTRDNVSTASCDDDDFTIHDPRGGGDDEDDNNWRHNDITTQTMRCVELRESCAGPMKEEEF
jgi:hypothetical protein